MASAPARVITKSSGKAHLGKAITVNAAGWRTFPVGADKRPLVTGWNTSSTPYSEVELRKMGDVWKRAEMLGILVPETCIVLDVDVKGNKKGDLALKQLQEEFGVLPETLTQTTKTGGKHLLFRLSRPSQKGSFPSNCGDICPSVDGAKHIDILCRHNRYMCLYDEEALLGQEIALLPEAWEQALRSSRKRQQGTSSKVSGVLHKTKDDQVTYWIQEVHDAEEGERHTTLNKAVLLLASQGLLNSAVHAELRDAALHSGLGEAEIERTIEIARRDGIESFELQNTWRNFASALIATMTYRNKQLLRKVVEIIADILSISQRKAVLDGELTFVFGLSCRDLAEKCNCSPDTANKALQRLTDMDLLRIHSKQEGTLAYRYAVRIPVTKPDSQLLGGVSSRLSDYEHLKERTWHTRRASIEQHKAFSRSKKTRANLPTGLSVVLAALETGDVTNEEFTSLVPCRQTRHRYLMILESMGLSAFDHDRNVLCPLFDDLIKALDEYCVKAGVPDTPELRRITHRKQRETFETKRAESILRAQTQRQWAPAQRESIPAQISESTCD